MAARALSEADVRKLIDGAQVGRPLPLLYFVETGDSPGWRALTFLLQCRRNGFMVILPAEEKVKAQLQTIIDEEGLDGDVPIYSELPVECETHRKRPVGEVVSLFCDFPWSGLKWFRKAATGGRSALHTFPLVSSDKAVVRPLVEPALGVADQWVQEAVVGEGYDTGLAEYFTGESQGEMEPNAPDVEEPTIAELQARIRELEAKAAPTGVDHHEARRHQKGPVARSMFEGGAPQTGDISPEDWRKLQAAAGAPPPGLAKHERQPRAQPLHAEDTALQEQQLEAAEEEPLVGDGSQTTLLKLLAAQTQMLARLTGQRNSDPITAALSSGSGSASEGGSSTGARGMAAREAYLKVLERHGEFAAGVAQRAQTELGVKTQYPGMMRAYLERKVPLRDFKTLMLMGFFFAHAWEAAREAQDVLFEAWAARGIVMIEQWAIDSGRSQAAWLMSGLPDPDVTLLQSRRADIRPYGRLAAPTWIAAQVAYLRDIEFLENRLRGKPPQHQTTETAETEETEDGPRRPRRPRRPKALADKSAQ